MLKIMPEKHYKCDCFITTVVCHIMGKDETCDELAVLRAFRDDYLLKNEETVPLVEQYYKEAPDMAYTIANDWGFCTELYQNYIVPIVDSITSGNKSSAVSQYQEMFYAVKSYCAAKPSFDVIKHHFYGGVYCKEMTINADAEVVSHKHNYDHLSVLTSGCVVVDVDDEQDTYYAPAIIKIKAGSSHRITAVNGPAHWLCIHATDCTDESQVDDVLIQKIDE